MDNFIPLTAMNLLRCTVTVSPLGKPPVDHTILVEAATGRMKDQLSLRTFQLGVVPVSPDAMRAAQVEGLFDVYDEVQAEQEADFLSHFWGVEDKYSEDIDLWRQREIQRLLDRSENGVKREPEPEPENPFSFRERMRALRIQDDLNVGSARYRRVQSRRLDYNRASVDIMVRLAVKGIVDGADLEREKHAETGIEVLTERSLETVRGLLGTEFSQLVRFITDQYGITKEEEKNSDSPAGSEPPPSGSEKASFEQANNDGSLTTSSTGPTPGDGSETTTEPSSAIGSATAKRTRKRGRTAAA